MTSPGFEVTNLPNVILEINGVDVTVYYDSDDEVKALNIGGQLVTTDGDVSDWCDRLDIMERMADND